MHNLSKNKISITLPGELKQYNKIYFKNKDAVLQNNFWRYRGIVRWLLNSLGACLPVGRLSRLIIIKENTMATLKNIHPGEILSHEFLFPFNLTAYKLSKAIDIPQTRISGIIKVNRRITADTALRLSKYFGNSAKFWLGLPDDFDIEQEMFTKSILLKTIKALKVNVA